MFTGGIIKKLRNKKADSEMCSAIGHFIAAEEGGRLLDIGMGSDTLLRELGDKGLNLYGVDISSADRDRSMDELALTGQASIEDLPYNDCFFDCVTSLEASQLWEDRLAAFAEILRVLKPGGQLLCAFRFDSGSGTPPREFRREAREAGFSQVTVKVLRSEGCYLLVGQKPVLSIVPMSVENVSEAAALAAKCLREAWSEEVCRNQLENPADHTLLAYEDGTAVGFLSCWDIQGEAEINNICVLPACRRRGIARTMLEKMFEELPHVTRWVLEVRESNVPAIGLYESLGFKTAGMRKNFYQDPSENALIMVKGSP